MREFLNAGLKVTANTDNRTVSNTTLTKELEFIQKNYGITDIFVDFLCAVCYFDYVEFYIIKIADSY